MDEHVDKEHTESNHETRDVKVKEIALSGLALGVGTFLVCLAMYGLFSYMASSPSAPASQQMPVTASQLPPQPRLEVQPALEYQQLLAHEDQVLSSYGWVDRKNGVVRIPIDRAMDLLLEQGLPTRKQQNEK